MLVALSLVWVAGLEMGTSTARGVRFPVPNRSYTAEREPAGTAPRYSPGDTHLSAAELEFHGTTRVIEIGAVQNP